MDKTVSSNGRVRGKPQRRGFESRTIPFNFREKHTVFYERGRRNLVYVLSILGAGFTILGALLTGIVKLIKIIAKKD